MKRYKVTRVNLTDANKTAVLNQADIDELKAMECDTITHDGEKTVYQQGNTMLIVEPLAD